MVQKFLNRPVLSTVLSIIICLVGLIGLLSLSISQYPDIAPPTVRVSGFYPGANADVVLKSVITPLEEQINGVENMTYIKSTAGNDGSATIQIYFEQGTNPDMAAVNVQNRVSAAMSKLPSEVTQQGVTTEKVQDNMLLMIALYSENPDYDETFVQNYGRINVYPLLQRVQGVGRVNVFGSRDYSMRVWLDPAKMASYSLNPSDVMAAIKEQNVEAAPGKFGENSNQEFQYTIKYKGKFTDEFDYENIVIKADENGRLLKLKDVARIELGAFDYSVNSRAFGMPNIGMAVYQIPGSNANDVVKRLYAALEESSKSFPPGIKYAVPYDTNKFLLESIKKVVRTFMEAFLLVFLVVYFFLQDFRSTLIPVISSVVAITGTFFLLNMFGFSINLLTLFGLVLAIGMVVDDAIVVVEAVHAKLEDDPELSVADATSHAMHEITGAIISITFVMSAVFFPVSFMTGPSGVFYRQFALTLASAMILSAINALTLSPVLCVMFIKPKHGGKESFMTRYHNAFNATFDAMVRRYKGVLKIFAVRRWIPVSMLVLFGVLTFVLIKTTPTGFIPNEDQGIMFADITLPPGASMERTHEMMNKIDSLAASIPEISDRMTVSGVSVLSSSNGGSYGLGVFSLKDWGERDKTVTEVAADIQHRVDSLKAGNTIFFIPPAVPGFGISDGFEVQLQDKAGGSLEDMYKVSMDFMVELMKRPEIAYATTPFNINFPQYEFDLDVDKCKLAGVNINEVFTTLQAYYGSMFVSDFNRFTKYYRVMLQASPEERTNITSLNKVMVRNNKGEMVPVSTLVDFKRVFGAESISRYNLFTAATFTGKANEGYSTGEAIQAVREVAAASLPSGYDYEFSGMTREEIKSGNQSLFIFALCFLFVYLILCAQYESYILPLSVMLSLIIGIFGVFFFIKIAGVDNNIYVQIALIMLIGLLAKNGILIVEFARQRREHGLSIIRSAIEAAVARLRPILMTSFAFIFGMIPLIIETGAGSAGNRSIGIAAAGGMFIGTVLGIFVIPTMYIIFETIDEKLRRKKSYPKPTV